MPHVTTAVTKNTPRWQPYAGTLRQFSQLSADFQSRALLFTEVFQCSLTEPQIMTLFDYFT